MRNLTPSLNMIATAGLDPADNPYVGRLLRGLTTQTARSHGKPRGVGRPSRHGDARMPCGAHVGGGETGHRGRRTNDWDCVFCLGAATETPDVIEAEANAAPTKSKTDAEETETHRAALLLVNIRRNSLMPFLSP